jgi:hypothetical protein
MGRKKKTRREPLPSSLSGSKPPAGVSNHVKAFLARAPPAVVLAVARAAVAVAKHFFRTSAFLARAPPAVVLAVALPKVPGRWADAAAPLLPAPRPKAAS